MNKLTTYILGAFVSAASLTPVTSLQANADKRPLLPCDRAPALAGDLVMAGLIRVTSPHKVTFRVQGQARRIRSKDCKDVFSWPSTDRLSVRIRVDERKPLTTA